MKKVVKKYKKISLIVGLLCIILGLVLFTVIYKDHKKIVNFYDKAGMAQASVFNVRKVAKDKYSFEAKYIVKGSEYTTYVKSQKREKELVNQDIVEIYYDQKSPGNYILEKPSNRNVFIAIGLLVVFAGLGVLNIMKYFKK